MGKGRDKRRKKHPSDGQGGIKTEQKTLKQEEKRQGRISRKLGEDDDEDVSRIVAQFSRPSEATSSTELLVCDPPSSRSYGVVLANPASHNEFLLYGGEAYDGKATTIFADLFRFNIQTSTWVNVKTAVTPPPRSAAQGVCVAKSAVMFGGEFSNRAGTNFHHYCEWWRLDCVDWAWTQLRVRAGPCGRSGHRMVTWQTPLTDAPSGVWSGCDWWSSSAGAVLLFGGFMDDMATTHYYNDLWLVHPLGRPPALLGYTSPAVESSSASAPAAGGDSKRSGPRGGGGGASTGVSGPSSGGGGGGGDALEARRILPLAVDAPRARAGCLLAVANDTLCLYGGYVAGLVDPERLASYSGRALCDAWILDLRRPVWRRVSRGGLGGGGPRAMPTSGGIAGRDGPTAGGGGGGGRVSTSVHGDGASAGGKVIESVAGRCGLAWAYDSARRRVVVFGGTTDVADAARANSTKEKGGVKGRGGSGGGGGGRDGKKGAAGGRDVEDELAAPGTFHSDLLVWDLSGVPSAPPVWRNFTIASGGGGGGGGGGGRRGRRRADRSGGGGGKRSRGGATTDVTDSARGSAGADAGDDGSDSSGASSGGSSDSDDAPMTAVTGAAAPTAAAAAAASTAATPPIAPTAPRAVGAVCDPTSELSAAPAGRMSAGAVVLGGGSGGGGGGALFVVYGGRRDDAKREVTYTDTWAVPFAGSKAGRGADRRGDKSGGGGPGGAPAGGGGAGRNDLPWALLCRGPGAATAVESDEDWATIAPASSSDSDNISDVEDELEDGGDGSGGGEGVSADALSAADVDAVPDLIPLRESMRPSGGGAACAPRVSFASTAEVIAPPVTDSTASDAAVPEPRPPSPTGAAGGPDADGSESDDEDEFCYAGGGRAPLDDDEEEDGECDGEGQADE